MSWQTDANIIQRLGRIEVLLQRVINKETTIMATLDDVKAKADALEVTVQSAVLELRNLAAGAADPAKINALADQLQASHDELQAAVAAAPAV